MNHEQALTRIDAHFRRHQQVIEASIEQLYPRIAEAAERVAGALAAGHKLLLCGNGGSAADAQHIAAEFTGRYLREREGLPAIALTTDSSALTAIGNDYGYERVFSRQFEALAQAGDVLMAYSTSGNSPNVLAAAEAARSRGCPVIALAGRDGGRLAPLADVAIVVPSQQTPHIQEVHGIVGHLICDLVDS